MIRSVTGNFIEIIAHNVKNRLVFVALDVRLLGIVSHCIESVRLQQLSQENIRSIWNDSMGKDTTNIIRLGFAAPFHTSFMERFIEVNRKMFRMLLTKYPLLLAQVNRRFISCTTGSLFDSQENNYQEELEDLLCHVSTRMVNWSSCVERMLDETEIRGLISISGVKNLYDMTFAIEMSYLREKKKEIDMTAVKKIHLSY